MLRLVLKIFLAYWMAAGVVIVVSDFEPHRSMHHPELTDALDSSLAINARMLVEAYKTGNCANAQRVITKANESLALATADGTILCGDAQVSGAKALVVSAAKSQKRTTDNYALFQLIATPFQSDGKTYYLVLKSSYGRALQIWGLLPGYTTISISCVVTLFLAVLIALPIRRLRNAAQQIAEGDLGARVHWDTISEHVYGFRGRDDIAKLVQDFNHMAERLQALAESQRMLLRDASHELRSPLARLSVGLGLARREASSAMRVHLDRIDSESKRLNELIGQILALSHLESIQHIDAADNVCLSEIVTDLLPDVQYEATQSGCVITATTAPDCTIRGDAELLRAAFENIVRNAIHYAPEGGSIQIETVQMLDADPRLAIIRISDNGPGIPESELKSVLEPFYRADRSRHWQKAGFGIGLAIAKRAASVHGGVIDIHNRDEGGLMVEMRFPLSQAA